MESRFAKPPMRESCNISPGPRDLTGVLRRPAANQLRFHMHQGGEKAPELLHPDPVLHPVLPRMASMT